VTLLANSGLQDYTVSTGGLASGRTYHTRVVLLRGGKVVAAGADRVFVAGSETPPDDHKGGGGNDGGPKDDNTHGRGGGTPPGGGNQDGGGGGGGSPPPPSPDKPDTFSVPKATMKGLAKTVRLDSKGRVRLTFRATPARSRGTVKLTYGKKTSGGSGRFTVATNGRVKLTIKPSKKLRAALRRSRSQGVKVTVTTRIGVRTFTARLTIKPYKKPAKRAKHAKGK
jgi:hypothetical protein